MKGVSDIFISKDKVAIFWFLVCVGILGFTGWYSLSLIQQARGDLVYLITNHEKTVYVDRSLDDDTQEELIDFQTRLALETVFNRGPSGPLALVRVSKLLTGQAREILQKDLSSNKFDFANYQFRQLCEIWSVTLYRRPNGDLYTSAKGQLVRVGVDPANNEVINQVYTFDAELDWQPNTSIRDKKMFPYVCHKLAYVTR